MIRDREPLCTFSDSVFTTALNMIAKSSVAQLIDDHYQHNVHPGGRRSGIRYTSTAVLVALLVRFLAGLPFSLRGAMDTIGAFTPNSCTRWAWPTRTAPRSTATLLASTNASTDSGLCACSRWTRTGTCRRDG